MMLKKYLKNILIGIDQLANAALGGDPDETISSRAAKEVSRGKGGGWKLLCRALHLLDKDHCREAIEEDEGKDAVWR